MDEFTAERRVGAKYLVPGERVVVFTRFHWCVLTEPLLTTLVGLAVVIALAWNGGGRIVDLLWYAAFALVARLVWRVMVWRNDHFVATDRRLLRVYGLLIRKVAMVPLVKVTDLTYHRSVPGRLLGYGSFVLESAGQEQAMRRLDHIDHPDRAYRLVMEQIFRGDGDEAAQWDPVEEPAADDDPTGPIEMAPWPAHTWPAPYRRRRTDGDD